VTEEMPRGRADSRRRAREAALQMLYQAEVGNLSLPVVRTTFWDVGADEPVVPPERVRAFAERLVERTLGSLERIDALIEAHSANWRLARMPIVDRIVLRLAVCELLEPRDTDVAVIIDEALELAKRFSTPDAAKFVNGVLDAIKRSLESGEGPAADG
jgi:N utilization substance protein B